MSVIQRRYHDVARARRGARPMTRQAFASPGRADLTAHLLCLSILALTGLLSFRLLRHGADRQRAAGA